MQFGQLNVISEMKSLENSTDTYRKWAEILYFTADSEIHYFIIQCKTKRMQLISEWGKWPTNVDMCTVNADKYKFQIIQTM